MSMRSLALRTGLRGLMEGTPSGAGRSSVSGLRYFSDSTGRILSEEERAKENVYIQKMERERLEKLKKKAEKEKAEREKSGKIAEEEAQKI
ncbi:uncharacterized protein At2g27730, mitochondrial [Ipomoea triloba]|uniref:uncharacterized protein At2g27730, mitochondrial n=1 Tax=Ipomoea triloba TaxID=35885 RepID=UPI00125E91DE|nr:uncharacterized protein At2g27730, mitochondrial [Ipomoea triloba]GLL20750.1 uncharacterized protein LOC109186629 [Ipomoea trifida]